MYDNSSYSYSPLQDPDRRKIIILGAALSFLILVGIIAGVVWLFAGPPAAPLKSTLQEYGFYKVQRLGSCPAFARYDTNRFRLYDSNKSGDGYLILINGPSESKDFEIKVNCSKEAQSYANKNQSLAGYNGEIKAATSKFGFLLETGKSADKLYNIKTSPNNDKYLIKTFVAGEYFYSVAIDQKNSPQSIDYLTDKSGFQIEVF